MKLIKEHDDYVYSEKKDTRMSYWITAKFDGVISKPIFISAAIAKQLVKEKGFIHASLDGKATL